MIKVDSLEQLLKSSEVYRGCKIYITIKVVREMEQLSEEDMQEIIKKMNDKKIDLVLTIS